MTHIAKVSQQHRNAVVGKDDEGESKKRGNEDDGVGAGKIDHHMRRRTNPRHTTATGAPRDDASSGKKGMNKQNYSGTGGGGKKRFWVHDVALLGFGAAMSWLLQQRGRTR